MKKLISLLSISMLMTSSFYATNYSWSKKNSKKNNVDCKLVEQYANVIRDNYSEDKFNQEYFHKFGEDSNGMNKVTVDRLAELLAGQQQAKQKSKQNTIALSFFNWHKN